MEKSLMPFESTNDVKKHFKKKEIDFMVSYATTFNKYQSMVSAGLHVNKRTGELYEKEYVNQRANLIMSSKFAQEFVKGVQKKYLELSCLTLERAFAETYENYIMLKERGSFHEMNIAYQLHLQVSGLLKQQNGVSVNQQFVSDKPITINYVQPQVSGGTETIIDI